MVYAFLTTGFELVEAATPIDLLRRGGVEVTTVSITGALAVESSSRVTVLADKLLSDCDFGTPEGIFLPGGPGTKGYLDCPALLDLVKRQYQAGRLVSAICAAPMVLTHLGIHVPSTIYPTLHAQVQHYVNAPVCQDGHVITGNAVGGAMDFSMALLTYLKGEETANQVANSIVKV